MDIYAELYPHRTSPCATCGERVAEHRARVKDGRFVCIRGAGEYGRGWQ
ncbi:TraR/DksA C4-type zinc finger protein [Methanoregula sp.]|nr:TraR/DksA C4-type zinc finger protein [Methanoregula sp.]MDD5143598.1 TraR/DksA C4-type zinc finger protein [Methanoregula sp.]